MYSDNDRYNSYYDPNFVIFEILVEYLSSQMYLTLVENRKTAPLTLYKAEALYKFQMHINSNE